MYRRLKDEDTERTFEYFDGEKIIEMPRDKMALKNTAIPSVFPNCTKYLTDRTQKPKRVSRDDKDETIFREAFRMRQIEDNSGFITRNMTYCITYC